MTAITRIAGILSQNGIYASHAKASVQVTVRYLVHS